MNSIKSLIAWGSKALQGYESPQKEAQILLAHALHNEIIWLMTHGDELVDDTLFKEFIKRRVTGEPIEYITGHVSFYSQTFSIQKGALIPRPETEILIDKLLENVDKAFDGHIVEVGVGSGIISIVLAQHLPHAKITAVDIAKEALEIAKKNIQLHGVEDRITLLESNLLDAIDTPIDIVVSNPPYIKERELLEKPLSFEPQNALFGGIEGDEVLKSLIEVSLQRDIKLLACEMGYDQKAPLGEFIASLGSFEVEFYQDWAGLDRGFVLKGNNA